MQISDISKLAWQLNVALIAATFSAVSLIYNDNYIIYGFVTFIFAIVSHFISTLFEFVYSGEEERKKRGKFFIYQGILILIWIIILSMIAIKW